MLLRIDPRYTVLWRTPEVLQLGAPTAVAIVDVPGEWELRLIELLRIGVAPKRLARLAERSRYPDARERLDALLAAVQPALDTDVHRRELTLPTVQVRGDAHLVSRFTQALIGLGLECSDTPDIVILIEHFVAQPQHYQALLAEDQRHIAVLCDDAQIRISPVVTPGESACLFCLELAQRAADPLWTVVATQLTRRRAASANTTLFTAAAIELSLLLEGWVAGTAPRDQLTTLCCAGRFSSPMRPHPECGCCSLPENVTELAVLEPRSLPSSPQARASLA